MGLFGAVIIVILVGSINTATLDTDSLKNLDVFVRRELVNKILWRLNETTIQQNLESDICQTKVKTSFSSCQSCLNDLCNQQTSSGNHLNLNSIFGELTPLIFKPQLIVGKFLDVIGTGLPSAVELLGSGSVLFINEVGGLANKLGNTFSSLTSVFHGLSSEFDKFGNNLIKNAGTLLHEIESGATNLLSTASKGTGSLLTEVGHETKNLLNGLQAATNTLSVFGQTIGDGLKNLGNTASNIIKSIFGKRQITTNVKRCNSACPVCDTIDLQAQTKEHVLLSVCGQLYVTQQKSTVQYLTSLGHLYNTTISSPILSEVTYNPASIATQGGVSFSNWNFTFSTNGQPDTLKIDSSLKITDFQATAKKIADKIWDITQN